MKVIFEYDPRDKTFHSAKAISDQNNMLTWNSFQAKSDGLANLLRFKIRDFGHVLDNVDSQTLYICLFTQ